MLSQIADQLHLLQYAHVLWGFAFFSALAIWVYLPSRKSEMQRHAALILDDDKTGTQSDLRGRHEQ